MSTKSTKKTVTKAVTPKTSKKTVTTTVSKAVTKSSSKKSKLSIEEKLAVITPRLRKGDYSLIAELTQYHPTMVSKVLRGKANNPSGEIINTAYTKFNKRKPTTV
jgi:hypothetical protein